MKICVLLPDYSTSDIDYQHYDPPRDLTAFLPGHTVDHVTLNKLTTYRQLKRLASGGYDVFVNLCEGYLEWDVPSIDVIESLQRLNLPFTGPTSLLYDPPKVLMKYVAYTVGMATPAHVAVGPGDDLSRAAAALRYPLFVKPSHAGDSLGVDEDSLVHEPAALTAKVVAVVAEYGEALIEEYIDGREFTVLVMAGVADGESAKALLPVEYRFPDGPCFKTYALKTSALHPDANVPVDDSELAARLQQAAIRIFEAFDGVGYARLDFRLDPAGVLHFLEINFTCSVFYGPGYEGSADHILRFDGLGHHGFAERIVAEGVARHRRTHRPYEARGNAVAGYGIFATRPIAAGSVVFRGEGRPQRIVTARHTVAWSEEEQLQFRRYAYPLSNHLFVLWDQNPNEWAPQNHSCEANTQFDGLDVKSSRAIAVGEELTLDYATFMNDTGEPFDCTCGAPGCRERIVGLPGNSVEQREAKRDDR